VAEESLRHDRERLDAVNTRQTRRCIQNYEAIFRSIGVG
jgi:hypothetical protein